MPEPGPTRPVFSAARLLGSAGLPAQGESVLALHEAGVFAVAQGVGRGVPADVAATASLRAIERCLGDRRPGLGLSPREGAKLGLEAANGEVWRLATAQSAYPSMAASAGLLILDPVEAAFLGMGGVRLLRWREGRLGLLHGAVGSQRRRLGEAPELGMRAVGLGPSAGDVYVLASEGIEPLLRRVDDLTGALAVRDPEQVVHHLADLAHRDDAADRLALLCVTVG